MFKKIHIIINPSSGTDTPVLSPLNKMLQTSSLDWEIKVTKEAGDAFTYTKQALSEHVDAVAVYGGDGTVAEAAHALFQTETPLCILPGGSANVVAKELGIPSALEDAVAMLLGNHQLTKIDMLQSDGKPVLLGYNIGAFAHTVQQTSRELKDKVGRFAYGITATTSIGRIPLTYCKLVIDGKMVRVSGSVILLTNVGNMGISGVTIAPSAGMTDGLLDIIVIREFSFKALIEWMSTQLTGKKPGNKLKHWQAKSVSLTLSQPLVCSRDDQFSDIQQCTVEVIPKALTVVRPL